MNNPELIAAFAHLIQRLDDCPYTKISILNNMPQAMEDARRQLTLVQMPVRLTSEEIARQKRDHDEQIFVSREDEQ